MQDEVTKTVTGLTGNRRGRVENLKPFKPGQSGNPNGRPKKTQEIVDLAKDNSEKALKKLVALIDSSDDKVALAAANAILDRSVGKPKQSVDVDAKHNVTHNGQEPVSETTQWIADTLRARAESQAQKPLPN
jgi:Family of unknown function (DUF5681)